jgi:hypothetical protein
LFGFTLGDGRWRCLNLIWRAICRWGAALRNIILSGMSVRYLIKQRFPLRFVRLE